MKSYLNSVVIFVGYNQLSQVGIDGNTGGSVKLSRPGTRARAKDVNHREINFVIDHKTVGFVQIGVRYGQFDQLDTVIAAIGHHQKIVHLIDVGVVPSVERFRVAWNVATGCLATVANQTVGGVLLKGKTGYGDAPRPAEFARLGALLPKHHDPPPRFTKSFSLHGRIERRIIDVQTIYFDSDLHST